MPSKSDIPNHLLVTGLPRTGATTIAAALARHRDVAMLSEARQEAAALLIGKQYAGNKLYMPAQVDYKFSEDTTGLLSLRRRPSHRKRGYLYSYMQQRSKIIVTYRDAASSINALVRSMSINADEAVRVWSRATEMTSKLVKHYGKRLYVCEYEALRNDPQHEFASILAFLKLANDQSCSDFLADVSDWGSTANDEQASGKLRLSELSPKAFAMYNGICSFRMNREHHLSEYPESDSNDFDSSDYPESDDSADDLND